MKVICIRDTTFASSNNKVMGITIGKIYEIVIHSEACIEIRNDYNKIEWYSKTFFMKPDEYRDKKLEELGI